MCLFKPYRIRLLEKNFHELCMSISNVISFYFAFLSRWTFLHFYIIDCVFMHAWINLLYVIEHGRIHLSLHFMLMDIWLALVIMLANDYVFSAIVVFSFRK
jgi:hypothetical protein